MAYTLRPYSNFLKSLADKKIDIDSDSLKLMLLASGYTPDYDAHDFENDLTNELATAGGYTAGGQTIANAALSVIAANSWGTARANSTAYAAGQIVRPASGNGFVYQAQAAGTSGGSVPTYPTTIGGSVVDGGVTWVCIGRSIMKIDWDDNSWNPSTLTARYAAAVDKTPGTAATNPLIGLVDMGGDISSTNNEFRVQWHADGVMLFVIH